MPLTKRVTGLDGVRGLAIAWVLLYHYFALLPKSPALAALPLLTPFANVGWIGVCLFFTLSGYLIIPLLAADRGQPGWLGRFTLRRTARLLPLYFILLATFVVAARLWPDTGAEKMRLFDPSVPFASYWVFVQNIPMAAQGYFGGEWLRVTWSLAVEVQFYVLVAVLVACLPRPALPRLLLVLSAAALAVRYAVVAANPAATAPFVLLLPCRLDAFLLGGWLALQAPAGEGAMSPQRSGLGLAVLLASAAGFVVFSRGGFGAATRWVLPLYYLMLTTGSAALLDLAAGSSPLTRWLVENPVSVRAGKLSYFLYLFHVPVLWTVFRLGFNTPPAADTWPHAGILAVAVLLLWLLAELSFRYLETPLIRRAHQAKA